MKGTHDWGVGMKEGGHEAVFFSGNIFLYRNIE